MQTFSLTQLPYSKDRAIITLIDHIEKLEDLITITYSDNWDSQDAKAFKANEPLLKKLNGRLNNGY